jgi:hypothetical protein
MNILEQLQELLEDCDSRAELAYGDRLELLKSRRQLILNLIQPFLDWTGHPPKCREEEDSFINDIRLARDKVRRLIEDKDYHEIKFNS